MEHRSPRSPVSWIPSRRFHLTDSIWICSPSNSNLFRFHGLLGAPCTEGGLGGAILGLHGERTDSDEAYTDGLVDFVSLAGFLATVVSRSFHRRHAAPYRDVLLTITVAVISPSPRSLPQRRLRLAACLPPTPSPTPPPPLTFAALGVSCCKHSHRCCLLPSLHREIDR